MPKTGLVLGCRTAVMRCMTSTSSSSPSAAPVALPPALPAHTHPRWQQFVQQLQASAAQPHADEAALLAQLTPALQALVQHDDWLPDAFAQPHPQHYQQYLLHADAQGRYSVVCFVWGPGQSTPIHNHTVWALIGMLRGAEIEQHYAQDSATGQWLPHGPERTLHPGDVQPLSPTLGDVHRVRNALDGEVSISIHVYGADIGRVHRHVFTPEGQAKPFVSGYTNVQSPTSSAVHINTLPASAVREALLQRQEIALLDVREEALFAQGHPLWAANLPASRLELDAWARIPRRGTLVVVYDNGEGLAVDSARTLLHLGYTQVFVLQDLLQGWKDAGYELFIDVNVPSKAFGEWVEHHRDTPSLPAPEVQALLDAKTNVVLMDARRQDEYHTMTIPGSTSVPGAELVLRAQALAPDPNTHIIVHCAGRTRSLIGTQSLINAGVPNRVSALRNGTIGWLLAQQQLEHGAQRQAPAPSTAQTHAAAERARRGADAAGVRRAQAANLARFTQEPTRTTYLLDVRSADEYTAGHLPGFAHYPGGQLVQETDHAAPVRGARIVLADDDGVRANMSASWLAQMGWEVWVVDGLQPHDFSATGAEPRSYPPLPGPVADISVAQLQQWLAANAQQPNAPATVVLDFTTGANYTQRHIPGAWFALRSDLGYALTQAPTPTQRYVVTCGSSLLARYAVQAIARASGKPVYALEGGTLAWIAAGLPLEHGATHLASPLIDRYRRPYEGTQAPREAMQAYLDWEFGLVEQLQRDGTHDFEVL